MAHSALFTTEKKYERPILIVDKRGIIGNALLEKLQEESMVVFVSKATPSSSQNIVHVPFLKEFPTIPDNAYSHIILIDEDLGFTKKTIENFLNKAKKDNSFIFLGVNEVNLNEKLVLETSSVYENIKIAAFGEIFSKDIIFQKDTIINKFIVEIKTLGRINIPGDGTQEISAVYLDDVIEAIIEICFGSHSENIFYLRPKYKTTPLTLASIFKKINPEIKIDFYRLKLKKHSGHIPLSGSYFFGEKYNLEERIKKINLEQTEDLKAKPTRLKQKNSKPIFLTLLIFFIILLVLPFLSTIFFINLGQALLNYTYASVKSAEEKNIRTASYIGLKSYELAGHSLGIFKQEAVFLRFSDKIKYLEKEVATKKDTLNTIYYLADSMNKLSLILLGNSSISVSDFSKMIVDFKNAIYLYNKNTSLKTNNPFFNNNISNIISIISSTIDTWPNAFGFNGNRSYLVLFQDSSQIRSSGGIINLYAILNLSSGKITDFKFFNASDSDAKLTTHIEPPFPIRRYLASRNWSLKNSSFDVDFLKTAVASATFLNSEEQRMVDGVISVDLVFINNLLKITGPVKLIDNSGFINNENFFSVFQRHQDKDFLKIVLQSISSKISNEKNVSSVALLNFISQAMYEKHLLFAFNNPGQEAIFAVNGFSAALVDDRVSGENIINDFVGISESSFAEKNINFYISRSLSQKVNLEKDGGVSEIITLTMNNSSQINTNNFYKNYIRFIFPENSQIKSIFINGIEQKITPAITDPAVYEAKNFKQPQALEVYKQVQSGKDVFGFLVTVSPQELKKIVINYKLSQRINLLKTDYKYSLKIFKQPGINFYPFDFSFTPLSDLKISKASNGVNLLKEKAEFSTSVYKDAIFEINFSPK